MKCLLVDDEPGIREGLAMLLRRRGHEVATAGDCAAATAALAANRFDVVVTDWRLPDGVAGAFVAQTTTPVVAMSGHPEEVERLPSVREVMQKPVTPSRLVEAIAAAAAGQSGGEAEADAVALVPDVQAVVDDLLAQLPAGLPIECHDDGSFVVLRARLPEGHVPFVRHLGGDLRIVAAAEGRMLELRLCRDGRPDVDTRVVAIDGAWPERGPVALDCGGQDVGAERFVGWLDSARRRAASGDTVCLLNVPGTLDGLLRGWETTHDMPMRARVGPRLPAELSELWS